MEADETKDGASPKFFSPTKSRNEMELASPSIKDPFDVYQYQERPGQPQSPISRRPPKKRRRLRIKDAAPMNVDIPEPFNPDQYAIDLVSHPKSATDDDSPQPVSDCEFPNDFTLPEDYVNIPDINVDTGETPNTIINDDTPKLYLDATITSFQAVTMLLSWFAEFPGISKAAFSRLLVLLHDHILPKQNKLPKSYKEATSLITHYLSPVKEHHACVNDCVLFRNSSRGNYETLTTCPECDEDRYHPDSTIPRKRFKFLSLETRVRRLFSDARISQLLQSHCTTDFKPPDTIDSIHQSAAWSNWYSSEGIFKGDRRSLSFGICMDGLNPFAHEKTSYSTCPISVVILNFPQHIRMLSGSMMLTGMIPGPKEPHNTDPYVDVLVDDVHNLNGLELYDAYRKEMFKLHANIVLHIFDYPGQNKVFHCQGAGAYQGCAYCCVEGEYCRELKKMVYLQHRAFLPTVDKLRDDYQHFPAKTDVPSSPPAQKTMAYIDFYNGQAAGASTTAEYKEVVRESGCSGTYSLRSMPCHDRLLNTPVEPMHLLKNVAERIVKFISGKTDTIQVRMEEQHLNRFKCAWVQTVTKDKKDVHRIPPAPFSLKKDEISLANARAMRITVPAGYDWKPHKIFGAVSSHMKSNEWRHVLASGILKFCIRGLLGKKQRSTLIELCDVVQLLCASSVCMQVMDSLEYRVHRVLSLLERDFPVTIHVISLHLLHHLPSYLRRFGPVYGYWMYPMERFNSWIARRVLNRRYPESTVLETFRIYELSFFLQFSGRLPNGAITDIGSDATEEDSEESSDGDMSKDLQFHKGPLNHGRETVLNADLKQDLYSFYCRTSTVYRRVLQRYSEEKRASSHHKFPPLKEWIPVKGIQLSATELKARQGPSDKITEYKVYVTMDAHHRHVRYGSALSERSDQLRISSYVYHSFRGRKVFGRIQYIFSTEFDEHSHTLAHMIWYEAPTTDNESGLLFIRLSHIDKSLPSILPLDTLSNPLIHAVDENNSDKLWILNA